MSMDTRRAILSHIFTYKNSFPLPQLALLKRAPERRGERVLATLWREILLSKTTLFSPISPTFLKFIQNSCDFNKNTIVACKQHTVSLRSPQAAPGHDMQEWQPQPCGSH